MEKRSKYSSKLIVFSIAVIGVLLRFYLRNDISGDYSAYLHPWYEMIQSLGINALKTQVGDYNLPYQGWIFLMTLIPIEPLYAFKIVSCLFDYLLAVITARVIYDLTGSDLAQLAGFCTVILFPQVWIDSAHWAQCDSIYAFWIVLAIFLYLREYFARAFFVFGIALSFKIQAIFVLPFMLIAWLSWGKHSFWKFLWMLPGFYAFSIPSILMGRKLTDPFMIYLNQATEYSALRFNFPSFWGIVFPAGVHSELNLLAILTTVFALTIGICRMIKYVQKSDGIASLRLCIWSIWTCVLFLPNMHERYAFTLDILMLILFFVTKRSRDIPLIAVCWMSSLVCYGTARLELPLSTDLFRIVCVCYAVSYFLYCAESDEELKLKNAIA